MSVTFHVNERRVTACPGSLSESVVRDKLSLSVTFLADKLKKHKCDRQLSLSLNLYACDSLSVKERGRTLTPSPSTLLVQVVLGVYFACLSLSTGLSSVSAQPL
jgi:hypothetical protein